MSAPDCFAVPAGELTDVLAVILWLPFLTLVVSWVLRQDWEWLIRRYRRRARLRAIREARTHA